jgi:signal transduction histidine kinase/DNA-binding response OmpR family regulator
MMSDSEKTYILVVDDLQEKRLAFEAVLENLGQNIVTATSGNEALKQVLLHDFAVILLDVNMPDMNGFETARLIRGRKRSANTPIIFLTAFTDEVRTAEGYATGAVDYLPTPIVPEILRAKVRVFVELFQMRQQVAQQAEEKARHAAAAEANLRLSFSAEAGAVLGRSLDFDATARDVVRLSVPVLADVTVLDCSPRSSLSRKMIVSQLDADGNYTSKDLKDAEPLSAELEHAMRQVTSNGDLISFSGADGVFCLILPLQARGRTFGAMALSREASQRTFNVHDETMAVAYASRAAIALDNAVLHHELQAADRQKNEFLSMLAHELRNPLAPIRNATQLLGLRASDEPDLQWIRDVIERQVVQMVRLVDDLLDISRITRGKIDLQRAPVELATIVAHAVETSKPLIDSRGHQLAVALPAHPVWVNGDLARLAQVLTNLLNNAAKYTEQAGQIWITARHEGNSAIISVRDTGSGIPSDMLTAIFDLFTQVNRTLDRSQGGLGIGLTLVRQLVEMHHGSVSAFSEGPDLGSEFTVTLPVLKDTAPNDSPNRNDEFEGEELIKILVVDDNADAADSMAKLLRLVGHHVDVAYDGPSGLAAAQIFEPSVIILDIGLPGMDGFAVAERVREIKSTRAALIIAVTGYGQHNDHLKSRQAGFDYHLTKPVELSALQALIKTGRPLQSQTPSDADTNS